MANSNSAKVGDFVSTTFILDVARLQETNVNSDEFKELLVRLYQNLNQMCLSLNRRDAGKYITSEFVNGQLWYPNPALNSTTAQRPMERQVLRKVINFGALPAAAGTKSVPHNIVCTNATTFTRIYATSSDVTNKVYIPIPYASSNAADIIELSVDATNVNITVASNKSSFTVTYVIVEYLQQ